MASTARVGGAGIGWRHPHYEAVLRERVAEGHSVESWARGVLDAAGLA